jgi:hypothetical protein
VNKKDRERLLRICGDIRPSEDRRWVRQQVLELDLEVQGLRAFRKTLWSLLWEGKG